MHGSERASGLFPFLPLSCFNHRPFLIHFPFLSGRENWRYTACMIYDTFPFIMFFPFTSVLHFSALGLEGRRWGGIGQRRRVGTSFHMGGGLLERSLAMAFLVVDSFFLPGVYFLLFIRGIILVSSFFSMSDSRSFIWSLLHHHFVSRHGTEAALTRKDDYELDVCIQIRWCVLILETLISLIQPRRKGVRSPLILTIKRHCNFST